MVRLPNLFDYQKLPVGSLPEKLTGLIRVRSPLLAESRLISLPLATEMFHFTRFAPTTYAFSRR